MKSFMILGSLVGFVIGAVCSFAGDCPLPTALGRACITALLAAMLTRWWSHIWFDGLQNAIENRHLAAKKAASEAKPKAKV